MMAEKMSIERALCPVLVGREDELTTLEDALLAAHRGEGQFLVLAGGAGVGKTRLARELQRCALASGATVLWGGCSEVDLALPYLPFAEALGNHLAAANLADIRLRLKAAGAELAQLFPQLGGEGPARDGGEDPGESKLRLFEAVLALLRIAADQRALLLVLEDIHWADASTRELLDYLSRRVRTTRMLLLATCRNDELHRRHPLALMLRSWRRAGTGELVELRPLPPDGVAAMVQAIFDQPVRGELRDFLHARSEGNPFVLEEFLKSALDRPVQPTAAWDLKRITELKIPPTVRDAILLRVERLSAEHVELLSAAAVLGPSFSYSTLVAVSGRKAEAVQSALRTFVQQQLMEEVPPTGERYRFRHALTREAIYEDLIAPRRAELHRRAADALRRQSDTEPVDLAHHLLAAKCWEEAVPVCLQAAEEAERRSAYRQAADLYERALPHVAEARLRALTLSRLGDAHLQGGSPARAQQRLEQAIPLLEGCGEWREAAGYRIKLGTCHAQRSRPDLARQEWERARTTLEPAGPSEDLAYACIHLASQQGVEGTIDAALALGREAGAIAEAAGADAPRILARAAIGLLLTRVGQVEAGIAELDQSALQARDLGLKWIAGNALVNGIIARVEHFRAREALEQVQALRALGPGDVQELRAARAEGAIYSALGEPEQARHAWERSLSLAREREAATFVRTCERGLAGAYAALGLLEEAGRLVLSMRHGERERQHVLSDSRVAVRILLDSDDVAGALHEAAVLVERGGDVPMPWRRWIHDVAAEARIAGGQIDEAESLVSQLRTGDSSDRHDPYLARMEGRLALARGDLPRARAHLLDAIHRWGEAAYREEESRTRRLLAQVAVRQGDRAAAEAELREVLAYSTRYGAAFERERAHEQLLQLGVDAEAEPATKAPSTEGEMSAATERLVTVMFVDVRGYTAMTRSASPPEMAQRIASFYRWVRQEVERRHGLVERYAGDAVMSLFNVSRARLDHCLLALQAAISIRDRAAFAGLPLGIGIAVGPAVVGVLDRGADLAALGDATNLAARLQAEARSGELVLSEEAFRRTRSWLKTQRLTATKERLHLKGFRRAVAAYRLVPAA